MGYEIAGALGVKMAAPDREVFALVGDGSYLMLSGEIVTAIQEGLKLIIVLVDNHGFASIGSLSRSLGTDGFGTRYRVRKNGSLGLDSDAEPGPLLPLDLAANAESLGAVVLRARTIGDLNAALSEAKTVDQTAAIHGELELELRARRMTLASSFCAVDFVDAYDPEPALATARLVNHFGCRQLLVAQRASAPRRAKAGRVGPEDGFTRMDWVSFAANLSDLGERLHCLGMTLAFHSHAGSAIETGSELERLCAATDRTLVQLCLDTGHLAFRGTDPLAFAAAHS